MKFFLSKIPVKNKRIVTKNKLSHAFLKGDCSNILENLPDESVDLIFTDPPYNANIKYNSNYNDNLQWHKYYSQAQSWFKEYKRILKSTGSLYLMNYPEVNARLLPYLEDELGLKLRRWITWHYPTNIGHSKTNFTRTQRSILFFTKSNKYTFNKENIIQQYKNPDVGKIKKLLEKGKRGRGAYDMLTWLDLLEMRIMDQKDKNIIDTHDINLLKNVSKDRLNLEHPCQLPFELIRRLLKVSSNKGDIVLDPFAGTFSTSAIAAELGRNSIGIELSSKYIKLGLKRFKEK